MTCVRGLKDYMICTHCNTVFTRDPHDVSDYFNLTEGLAYACSQACAEKIRMGSLIDHMKRKPKYGNNTRTGD